MTNGTAGADLAGTVIAVAGAGGPAGRATLNRLAASGATVAAADANAEALAEAVQATRRAVPEARIAEEVVDLLDPRAAVGWAERVERAHGRVDGLVHLVGGWRGSKSFTETDLADWAFLDDLLVRTVQHTSLAFHDPLLRAPAGRFVLISQAGATRPTAGNAAYAAAKAAAEAWTLAMADSFRKAGGERGPTAAATVLVVKALVHEEMRVQKPDAKFPGFTDVGELAGAVADLWGRPAREVNGERLWLTPRP